jgi:hypothetical protein
MCILVFFFFSIFFFFPFPLAASFLHSIDISKNCLFGKFKWFYWSACEVHMARIDFHLFILFFLKKKIFQIPKFLLATEHSYSEVPSVLLFLFS